jgi:formylglycine-generating enzyme required for sulfatase activity
MRTKILSSLSALATAVATCSIPAQPTLNIAPNGNQTVLFWPTWDATYVLQSTTNLGSPNWTTVSDAVPVTALVVSNTLPASYFRLQSINGGPTNGMVLIPSGAFIMGDTLDSNSDATPIITTVSDFYMDMNLISYSQWQSIYNWAIHNGYAFDNAGAGQAGNNPVQVVNWYDCVKWCNARSELAGLTPCYYTDANATNVYRNGESDLTTNCVMWSANGFRLPTEAEWEKAARGGLSGLRFPWANTISESQANYFGETYVYAYDLGPNGYNPMANSAEGVYTTPVGSFAPNAYGLYDMAGNVFEWCWDWLESPYQGGTDPLGLPLNGSPGAVGRVIRGGSGEFQAFYLRCANRWSLGPLGTDADVGFRCVRRLQ